MHSFNKKSPPTDSSCIALRDIVGNKSICWC